MVNYVQNMKNILKNHIETVALNTISRYIEVNNFYINYGKGNLS